ncbi:MAG: copper-translocating P-type ATPase [Balneolaceae bacterium]|nr:MAG: copper-translocating P-type ATPase [Balneolaceae bacterium]
MILSWAVTLPLMIWMFLEMVLGLHMMSHLVMELAMVAGASYVIFRPGRETLLSAARSARVWIPNMDVLIALGTLASLLTGLAALGYELGLLQSPFYSFAGIAAMIMAFHLTGRYVETKARGRASEAITRLLTLEAATATLIVNGIEKSVPADELRKGDVMIIRTGETVPADGVVVDGKGSLDEAMITGEPMPVTRTVGDPVVGGTINREGFLRVKVTVTGEDTFLSRVIRLVEEAQGSKVPIQDVADKVTAVFVPVILLLSLATFLAWLLLPALLNPLLDFAEGFIPWIVTDLNPVGQAFFAALAVLVIACPCALGLATPTALMVGSGLGAENGILIRRGEAIQRLQEATVLVFDKTGTLTQGKPEVAEWVQIDGEEAEIKTLVGSLEKQSEHPVSLAITEFVKAELTEDVRDFETYTGMGVCGMVGDRRIVAGNLDLMDHFSIPAEGEAGRKAAEMLQKGYTTIFIASDGRISAVAGLTDQIKDGTAEMIQRVKMMGYRTIMLTGDQEKSARLIADQIGIEQVIAGVKPDQKSEVITGLQKRGEVVVMIGDGVNDAPALSAADVGIAMGTGTDIAIEAGSVILVDGHPNGLVRALNLSRETFRKIRQNLFWAFFYNVVMIPVAVIGWMHPVLAEAAMAFSSVNVVGNSRRLSHKKLD